MSWANNWESLVGNGCQLDGTARRLVPAEQIGRQPGKSAT